MLSILKHFLLKDPSKYWFWLLLSLLIKGLPFIILLHNGPSPDTVIANIWGNTGSGDTISYLSPIDNLLNYGSYLPDHRLPGYGIVYLIFRLFFTKIVACNLVILFQFLLAILSVYYLALTAKYLFSSNRMFYISFYIFLISTYSNFYDSWLMTESLCTSSLIFAIYFFTIYFNSYRIKNLIISGLFVTWVIFLRPIFFPLPIILLSILILQLQNNRLPIKKAAILLISPFLLTYTAWITKISLNHNRLILQSVSLLYPKDDSSYVKPLYGFLHSWGGYTDMMYEESALGWFGYMPDTIESDFQGAIPDYIYTSKFNKDSLLKLRHLIVEVQSLRIDPFLEAKYQKELKNKFTEYTASVQKEKPYVYYVKAPLFRYLPRFIYGPETKLYMRRGQAIGLPGDIIESFYIWFYFTILLLASAGIFLLLLSRARFSYILLIVPTIPLYIIVIHPIILRAANNRYLMPSWPFLLLCAAYTLNILYGIWENHFRIKHSVSVQNRYMISTIYP